MNTDDILEKLARPGIYVCVWPGSVAFVETDADGVQHQLKPETFERDGVLRRDRWNCGVGSSIHGPFQRAPAAGKWRKHVLTAGECPPQSKVVLAGALERLERAHGNTQDGGNCGTRCTNEGASMSGVTDDPNDPGVKRGPPDETPVPQHEKYIVLSDSERAKGFVRPVRRTYVHEKCGGETTMGRALAETYARDPLFYGVTYCCHCSMHRPVGKQGEFSWLDGSKVGV